MAHLVVCPAVGFFFSLMQVPEEHRNAVKLGIKNKIEQIDPTDPADPADTARYKWDSLTPVSADHNGHIDEDDVKQHLQEQLGELPANGQYAVGAQVEWCYVVRGGDIYCYHCYALTTVVLNEHGEPELQPVVVRVVVYNDADGNPYPIPFQYQVPLSVTYSWKSAF